MTDVVDELLVDDRMGLKEVVVRLAQAELLEVTDGEAQHRLEHHPAQAERQAQGEEQIRCLIRRATEGVFGVVVVAAARGMEGLPSILRTLDSDIAAGVAGANDKDALTAHDLGTLVVGGMLELTGEGVLAGILRDLGPPVVAVGDDDSGVLTCRLHTTVAIAHGDVPAITVSGCDGDDLGVEGQMVEQTEVLGVGAEVAVDLPV